MIKAAFFDVDGTLLSHRTKQIPPSARAALDQLRAAGIQCVVATGRMIQEMDKLPMGKVNFDAYITMNGQMTLDANRELICGVPLEGEIKAFVLKLFEEKQIPVILVEQDRLYVNFVNDRVTDVQAAISSKVPPVDVYRGAPIYQVCVYVTGEEEKILAPAADLCEITRWHSGGVDVIAKGGGKRSAIECYIQMNGIRPEEIIAFGDGENDMGMLMFAEIGVALGNAEEKVKTIADYVADDIDEDGLAKALQHFGLI